MTAENGFHESDPFADGFGDSEHSTQPLAVALTGPPFGWLAAGVLMAIVGGAVAWLVGSLAVAAAGWLLAGPVGLTLVAWYVNRDNHARVSGVYQAPGWTTLAYAAGVAICVLGVLAAALRVAEGVGRL